MRIAIAVVLWIICVFLLVRWLPDVTDAIMGFNEDQKQTFEDVSAANKQQIETAAKLRRLKQNEDEVGASALALAKGHFGVLGVAPPRRTRETEEPTAEPEASAADK